MTPDKAIKTVLEPIAGLQSKVYPVDALKNATAPFVFYVQKEEDGVEDLDGTTDLQTATYEIHCVAKSYAALVALCKSVKSALQNMQGNTYAGLLIERAKVRQTSPDLNEREVKLMRRVYTLHLDYQGGNDNE